MIQQSKKEITKLSAYLPGSDNVPDVLECSGIGAKLFGIERNSFNRIRVIRKKEALLFPYCGEGEFSIHYQDPESLTEFCGHMAGLNVAKVPMSPTGDTRFIAAGKNIIFSGLQPEIDTLVLNLNAEQNEMVAQVYRKETLIPLKNGSRSMLVHTKDVVGLAHLAANIAGLCAVELPGGDDKKRSFGFCPYDMTGIR